MRRCLDKQTGRCTDRQSLGRWSPMDRAFRCLECGGITKTDQDAAAGARVIHTHNGGIK